MQLRTWWRRNGVGVFAVILCVWGTAISTVLSRPKEQSPDEGSGHSPAGEGGSLRSPKSGRLARTFAERWRCSRATVYNRLRRLGTEVLDFSAAVIGRKPEKMPAEKLP